jgi:hypothetical protein
VDGKKKWDKGKRKIRRRGRGEDYQCFGDENHPEVSLYRIYAIYAG